MTKYFLPMPAEPVLEPGTIFPWPTCEKSLSRRHCDLCDLRGEKSGLNPSTSPPSSQRAQREPDSEVSDSEREQNFPVLLRRGDSRTRGISASFFASFACFAVKLHFSGSIHGPSRDAGGFARDQPVYRIAAWITLRSKSKADPRNASKRNSKSWPVPAFVRRSPSDFAAARRISSTRARGPRSSASSCA